MLGFTKKIPNSTRRWSKRGIGPATILVAGAASCWRRLPARS